MSVLLIAIKLSAYTAILYHYAVEDLSNKQINSNKEKQKEKGREREKENTI